MNQLTEQQQQTILNSIKRTIRIKSTHFDDELTDLIFTCLADLEISGIYVTDFDDYLIQRAIVLYARSQFGEGEVIEKELWADRYFTLKVNLALTSKYKKDVS